MRIPFIGGSYRSRSQEMNAQRSVNWYPEFDTDGQAPIALYPRPGLKYFTAVGGAEVRAMEVFAGALYVVTGAEVKKVAADGSVSAVGTLATSTGRVGMAHNATQLMVVDGVDGWIWDGATFTKITDVDFPNADQVVFHEGYFVVNKPNSARFYISVKDDGLNWDAAEFGVAERAPDNLKAVISNNRELWLLGEETTEIWYNTGATSGFPFEPLPNGFVEWGVAAPWSAVTLDAEIVWLAQNGHGQGIVMRANGSSAERISTHAVEEAIDRYGAVGDAFAYTFHQKGHIFYVLTFPTGNATWVWDQATGLWHEWSSFGGASDDRFAGNAFAAFQGRIYVGDKANGRVYQLDPDSYRDDGTTIRRIRETQHLHADRAALFHRALEIQFEAGVGNADAANPQAMLQWSDDGGRTYGNEMWRPIGQAGAYRNRTIWRQLGRSHDRVYRLVVTDPVKAVVVAGHLDAQTASRPLA